MHRFILDAPDGAVVDHINGNALDNRRANLRLCTPTENAYNKRKRPGTVSQYKGVSWDSRNQRWMSQLTFKNRHLFLGRFDDEQEAARAYDVAARKHFGEFANLNFKHEATDHD